MPSVAALPMTHDVRTTPATACPSCGQPRDVRFAGLRDRILAAPGAWQLRACELCRLWWLDPQPDPADIGRLYQGAYMTHAAAEADASLPAPARAFLIGAYGYGGARRTWLRWLRHAAPVNDLLGGLACWLPARPGGRLLDVGCGSGAFLCRMQALDWDVQGVEPDPAAAEIARRRGFPVSIDLDGLGSATFDAITVHHVIEHLTDPAASMRAMAARLRPGGRLVVVTPNPESLGRRWFGPRWVHLDPPRHLRLMSTAALTRMAGDAGLEVDRAWTTGRYARFVWVESVRIGRTGRIGTHRPAAALRITSLLFQAIEQALTPLHRGLGEEAVLLARRPAGRGSAGSAAPDAIRASPPSRSVR